MQVNIADIKIGDRYRKDMGDIEGLARSMNESGLIHPVALAADNTLIAGERRILAARLLGWESIEAHYVDLENLLRGEQDENKVRKDFTVTEAVAIANAVQAIEEEKARARKATSNAERVNFTPSETGKTRDKVSQAVGMSWLTLEKAREVVEAAEQEPELFGPIAEEMDRTGKVAPAYEALQEARRPHVANNSGDNEWYTPAEYIEAARFTMGGIDLDPASTEVANTVVRAERFYTAQENGLDQEWFGRVWMNPPYAQPLVTEFCEKLAGERDHISQAVVLVNNATETRWFQGLAAMASAICFPVGRVRFWAPDKISAPLQGQAVLYIGDNTEAFIQAFADFGFVMVQTDDELRRYASIREGRRVADFTMAKTERMFGAPGV